jgi:cytidine deaminase
LKKHELKIVFVEYDAVEKLSSEDKKLVIMAKKAAKTAYAPYSDFHVGAAVLLENGVIVTGNNQENVAYPSGLCAERVAVFAASSQYAGIAIKTIAITAKSTKFIVDSPVTPCGSCRQVLAEYEHLQKKPIRIILSGEKGKVFVIEKVDDLLPLSFKADKLKK